MDSERGNFIMKAQQRNMLLKRENFLFDRATAKVNYGIRGGRQRSLRPIMAWVGIVGSDESELRGVEHCNIADPFWIFPSPWAWCRIFGWDCVGKSMED
jgi:hypothetical protein